MTPTPTELTITVQLSPEDRELLRRIADRLDASADTGADTSFGDSARRLVEDFPPEFKGDRTMLKDVGYRVAARVNPVTGRYITATDQAEADNGR